MFYFSDTFVWESKFSTKLTWRNHKLTLSYCEIAQKSHNGIPRQQSLLKALGQPKTAEIKAPLGKTNHQKQCWSD